MSLDIWFSQDIRNALLALAQANDRALALALRFGADPEWAHLARAVYAGALADVGVSFGLAALANPNRKGITNERPIDGGPRHDRISEATAGHRRGIGPSDGQGAGRGAEKTNF